MAFPGSIYAPPGVYTRTLFESPTQGLLQGLKIPVFIGTGSEILTQHDLEVVRGSSSSVDQQVVQEDLDGRAVLAISTTGQVTLGDFNGTEKRVQVRNYPIVDGTGSGTTATKTSAVSVTINNQPIVVLRINGAKGILELSTAPDPGDVVRATYFFNRTDTQITDDLSDQITEDAAVLRGLVGESYEITADVNDALVLTVDDEDTITITLPDSGTSSWSASQIASFINSGATGTTLSASTYTTNYGETAVLLTADRNILMGAGTVNSTLGFTSGDYTARNKTFYTYEGPIVDGSNGGITTTDPADVVVKVNGVQVIPAAVDGSSRAVTLPFAPENTATVTVTYYFNSWQDTFDYLAHREVTDILECGVTPGRNDFVDGADFVLKNDLILWGTAVTINSGEHTQGTEFFDDTQITATLVDTRGYLEECSPVTDTSVNPPVTSTTQWQLPRVPTTGNGRNSPLGSSLFQTVSNNRLDLPTNRPDLVVAYWGFSPQDAIERGPVDVLKVESSTSVITLKDPVPVGASVYCTLYYNTLTDTQYTVHVEVPGASGVGSYYLTDEEGDYVLAPKFGAKGTGLTGITVEFPSGSERTPDCRFETPFDSTYFDGPVEEDVTVTFKNKDSTLAKYTVPGAGPYYPIWSASDHLDIEVDGSPVSGGYIRLSRVLGVPNLGFWATMVGDEIEYDADSGGTTYEIDATNNEINLRVDGVLIEAAAATGTLDLDAYVTAINTAALATPPEYAAATKFTSAVTLTAGEYDTLSLHYTGDVSGLSGNITAVVAAGTYNSPTTLAAAVEAAISTALTTAGVLFTVAVEANSEGQMVFALSRDPADASGYLEFIEQGAVAATGTMTVSGVPAVGDQVQIGPVILTGVSGAPGALQFQQDAGTPELVAQSIIAGFTAALVIPAVVTATTDGAGAITLTAAVAGSVGNLVTMAVPINVGAALAVSGANLTGGSDSPNNDFSVLAGISTDGTTAQGQVKLVDGPIARRYTVDGDNTGSLLYDRIILRNRLVPGNSNLSVDHVLGQTGISIEGSTGAVNTGLTVTAQAPAGLWATVMRATLLGVVGFSGGQASGLGDERDGQPLVTFYAAGGTNTQNNVFKFTFDGTPVTVEFVQEDGITPIPSGGSADVPLGPASPSVGSSIIRQIAEAMAAAGIAPTAALVISSGLIRQEGAGIRLTSALFTQASSIVIGNAGANDVLGFGEGDTATRTPVTPALLASAMMAHSAASVAVALDNWENPTATYFAAEALASVIEDDSNAEYLYVQSAPTINTDLGTSSSIVFQEAASMSVTLPGVGLGVEPGDGASGEAGISGFYVTSSDTVNGSGTVNNSLLNAGGGGGGIGNEGDGQDGLVGQTYRDMVTGLTFTILPREGGTNYPGSSLADSFTFTVRRVVTTDSNLPINSIPGLELLVTNTNNIGAGDTALVETYERGGNEPSIGDVYYVSYNYQKQDFSTQLYTKFSAIEAAYGELSLDNPVTLATFLAITNGAVLVGVKQVEKDVDEDNDGIGDSASIEAYREAVDELEGSLSGGVLPDILVPLRGDSVDLFAYIARHCDIQSSIRYRAERTSVAGVSAGTEPREAQAMAQAIGRTRFRLVYPDIATLTIDRADGSQEEFIVGGVYLASALVGSVVSPNVDVATPWTGRKLFGFNQLARTLDAVEQNQTAVRGITVLEDRPPIIRVRQGLTTDMTSVLTKLPTIILIADEVQQQARKALDRFVGIKFLPGVLSQIEGQLATTLRQLVEGQIIAAYTGVSANVAADDPTVAEIEAYYQPVFPLLYLVVTFNLRSSL